MNDAIIKALKARRIKWLMYFFIVLYLVLVIVKIYFDIQNGYSLDDYRYGCEPPGSKHPVEPKNCDSEISDINEDETQRMVPQILFGSFNLIWDLSIVFVGVYFFYKLCSFFP